jgi:tetratricopeptide (TPR) repeat protein
MRTLIAAFCLLILVGCQTVPPPPPESSPRAQAFNHYLMGDIHRRNGRFEEAIDEFIEAYHYAPDEPFLAKQIIRGYLMIHDLENARGYAETLVEEYPDDPAAWFILGRIYRQQERYEEASDAFEKALRLTAFNVFIYDELLKAEEESNDLISVVDIYLKLVQLHPQSAVLHERLGLSLARIGHNEEAKIYLQKALELDSSLEDARNILGLIHLELDENESAAAQFRRYLASVPDDTSAREHFAAALARLGRYDEALGEFNALCEQDDSRPRHHLARMFLLMQTGNAAAAGRAAPPNDAPIVGTLFRALARKMSDEPYLPLLESLDEAEGDISVESSAYLQEILFLFGADRSGDYLLEIMGDIAETGFASLRFNILRARILMVQERHREAERVLTETLDRFGPDKWLHYYLAITYEEMDDLNNTEKHLKACLELDPNDPDVLNFLGYFYADNNYQLDKAEELLDRALEMSPENGFYLDSLGWVYYRQKKAAEPRIHIIPTGMGTGRRS